MVQKHQGTYPTSSPLGKLHEYLYLIIGAAITAFGLEFFLVPNRLIDGGTVGIAMLFSEISGTHSILPLVVLFLTLPFVVLAYKHIGKRFVARMLIAISSFSIFLHFMENIPSFSGDILEIVFFGGICIGTGIGLIIKNGGCLDGSEILAIILNKRTGFTVGQIILVFNVIIFFIAGFVYGDWNSALRSLMTYVVAYKIIDSVIEGFDEVKSVTIISRNSQAVANAIMHEMGIGLTVMYGRGGFSGDNKEILYVIIERLQLVELKTIVQREDPNAFIAIEDLHEIVPGTSGGPLLGKRIKKKSR